MDRKRKEIIARNEISELHTFNLGNVPQKVLIEGRSRELPIVISLHGGPGTPIPFSGGCRGLFPAFTDRFIMVYWDQLGCGMNDYKLKDAFDIESFVNMTVDLISEVKKLFPDNRIILFGMSWGSVLTLKACYKAEDKIDAVVVWGQVLKNLFLNDEVYESLEQSGISERKMQKLRSITVEHFRDKDMQLLSNSVRKYTDGYNNKQGEQAAMGPIIKGLLTSPDYSLKEFKAIMMNGTATSTRLWPELLKIDLTEALQNVTVPYYILQGDTDIVTSTTAIVGAVERSENSNLHCRIVKDSGHMPGKAGMDEVFNTLVQVANE